MSSGGRLRAVLDISESAPYCPPASTDRSCIIEEAPAIVDDCDRAMMERR
jgi:hypothetical protein